MTRKEKEKMYTLVRTLINESSTLAYFAITPDLDSAKEARYNFDRAHTKFKQLVEKLYKGNK